jgi:hypothetical protein
MIHDTETLSPTNPQFPKLCTCSRVEAPKVLRATFVERTYGAQTGQCYRHRKHGPAACCSIMPERQPMVDKYAKRED